MAKVTDSTRAVDGVEEITREEIVVEIERGARDRLGMSYEEFLAAYKDGGLPDTLAANELVIISRFAGLGRGTTA